MDLSLTRTKSQCTDSATSWSMCMTRFDACKGVCHLSIFSLSWYLNMFLSCRLVFCLGWSLSWYCLGLVFAFVLFLLPIVAFGLFCSSAVSFGDAYRLCLIYRNRATPQSSRKVSFLATVCFLFTLPRFVQFITTVVVFLFHCVAWFLPMALTWLTSYQ